MNPWALGAAFLVGAISMAALGLWLLWRSHENFRKMCSTNPKG